METATVYLSEEKRRQALDAAHQLFMTGPDWLTFFRRTLGIDGTVRQLFPGQEEFVAFERTEEYSQIQQMVTALRALKKNPSQSAEPTRVITVRLPKSVHEALRAEANDHDISMNWLCIAKLLQAFQDDNLPTPPGPVRKKPTGSPQLKVVNGATTETVPYPIGPTGVPYRPQTATNRLDGNHSVPAPHAAFGSAPIRINPPYPGTNNQ
ncbi:MAG: toxin-antitoxin system HicB family antitoxin [Pirellulaceae bacterium]|nr:toxin-antitoxin system HicB family antitoxin [Planctomycetales bacterium]